MVHKNVWNKEAALKALDWLEAQYAPGEVFAYDGHGDCWLMLAVMYRLRDRDIQAYIGAFGNSLPIRACKTEGEPPEKQSCTFEVAEQGDDVLVTVHLSPDAGPFDCPMDEIVAPALPAGKNIYLRLDGRHLLNLFPLALTYGDTCRTLCVDYADECVCSVSHVPEVETGDHVTCPFA